MSNSIIVKSLKLYFQNYFNIKDSTARINYWWAISFIYLLTIGLSNIAVIINFMPLVYGWLLLNIIPLLTLTIRRLKDIGLTNQAIICIFTTIIITAFLVLTIKSALAATILQILIILIVLAPLLKTDELTTIQKTLFTRQKESNF